MAVTTVTSGLNQVKGINYTVITDSSSDWPSVGNDVYFYDKATSLPYYKNASGTVVSIFEEGGVTSNIYTADGTVSGDRIVDLDNKKLTFDIGGGVANGVVYDGSTITNTNIPIVQYKGVGTNNILSMGETGLLSNLGITSAVILRFLNTSNKGIKINNSLSGIYSDVTEFRQATTTTNTRLRHYLDSTRAETQYYDSSNNLTHHITLGTPFGCSFFNNGVVGGFLVGSNTLIGTEDISLQGDTLISKKLELSTTTDGFLMPRLTTAQMNAISTPDTDLLVFNTDLDCVMRYNGTAWTTFDTPKYILKTGGACTPYSDLYTAINDAVNGSIIDVNISETVDCGGISNWTWSNDITINFNGHHTIFSNLDRIILAAGVSLGISNGTFEMASNSINTGAIMFSGGNTVKGDGAINVFQNTGGSARGSFQHSSGTASNYISGVIMKGSYTFCVRGGAARIYIDNCILYTDLSTNVDALYGDNIEISNSTIYGRAFSVSGTYTIPSRETVRVFNNCTIISDGESAIGSRSAIFNSCTITTNDDEVRIGIGGEQEYYNCKLERTGTVGIAFNITNASNVRMYHTQIISTGSGVSTNLPMEFYNCYIKANSGNGIINTSGAGMIIRGGTIDSTGGSTLLFNTANVSGIAKVSNVTLMCNTTGKYCLEVNTNTTLTFSNLSMKNTSTSTDIYSRAGILSENLQIETTDAFGNIILK